MPVVLAVREIKVEVQSHEWDKYGKLCISLGDRVKSTEPEHCEYPFVTKWGGVDQKQSLAVFETPTQSKLHDSLLRVDILTGPREQGPFDRLFGRCEFYLGDLKIKQPFETLHLTCSVYDPLRRRTNVRSCPRMILKCRWSWKKEKTVEPPPITLSPMPSHIMQSGTLKGEKPRITKARTMPIEITNEMLDVTPKKGPDTAPSSASSAPCTDDELSPAKKEKEKYPKNEVPLKRPKQRFNPPTFIAPKKELKDTLELLLGGADLLRAFSQVR